MKKIAAVKSELSKMQDTVRRLENSVEDFPKDPTPRRVHKLRTRIHHFQSQHEFSTLSRKKQAAALQKALDRIRKRAGKVRDSDVFASHLASLHHGDEEDCLVQLLLHIGDKRRRQARKLSHLVQARARRLTKRLKSAQKRLRKLASHRDQSSRLLNERLTDALSAASHMATPSRRNLHDQRKAIKHLRDIMSLSAEPSYRPVLKALGDAKDSIGEWHDWEELQRLARKNLTHGRGCKLISILGAVSQKKFNEALRVTKGLRRLLHSERIHSTLPVDLQMSASRS